MSQSDDFFDSMFGRSEGQSTDPKEEEKAKFEAIRYYQKGEFSLYISFVDLKQRRSFFNYSRMLSAEYDPTIQRIKLTFSENMIELEGMHLEKLYYQLMENQVKEIIQQDKRYIEIRNSIPTVFELKII
ncbi:hypothetical protein SAMN03080617_00268 [Algoriphagus alkaliphilus]|uniref:Uncharacterized protein n=1 Tax=Algoriphagus alkaliphilus TaxID=279824 RepID=A0A1G5V1B3_9BACT|nr:hypothetical protein [Algoriphagus alkaliphilus]SDA39652.1 hypothetical protein SAMN03080617_00268 [Algoriphagus alkaliphilus]